MVLIDGSGNSWGIIFEKMPMIEHAILSASLQGLEYLHSAASASRTASFGHGPMVSVITAAGSRRRLARDEANLDANVDVLETLGFAPELAAISVECFAVRSSQNGRTLLSSDWPPRPRLSGID